MLRVEPASSSSRFRPSSPAIRRTRRSRTLDCVHARWRPPSPAFPCTPPDIPQRYRQMSPPTQVKNGLRSVHVDRDVLGLEVLLDALETALAADARPLPAAEWRSGVRDHALVEADHAGLESLDHADCALEIAREHVGD